MKSKLIGSVSVMAIFAFASVTWACPGCKGSSSNKAKTAAKKGSCCGSKVKAVAQKSSCCGSKVEAVAQKGSCCGSKATTVAQKGSSDSIEKTVDTILASMPAMQFMVEGETIDCSMSAGQAVKDGKEVKYVVGKDVFATEEEANVRLTSLVEKEIKSLQSMQYAVNGSCGSCPMTAKRLAKEQGAIVVYRVGGMDFSDQSKAEKAVALVQAAANEVKMTYKVGDNSFRSNKMADEAMTKSTAKSMTYLAGKETPCCKTAATMLSRAKVTAIVKAAVQANQL